MIVNNTQANIFKVNGGLADNFANRPTASSSFYIFYSIDTQEIYYDNGTWVLIGSSGGTPINIYNSDGTLTGDRTLNGNNKDLVFNNLNYFLLTTGINAFTIAKSVFPNVSGIATSSVNTSVTLYALNQINSTLNTTFFVNQSLIKTIYGGTDIGLKLDFANQQYILGNAGTLFSIYIDDNLKNVRLGDQNINFNGTAFELDDTAQFIRTIGQTSINGLYFDFANSIYQFGQITGNNTTYLQINDVAEILQTQSSNLNDGLNFDFANEIFKFGQIDSANGVHIKINGSAGIDTLQTIYNNNNQGIDLQFNNDLYRFGHMVGGNQTQINVIDNSKAIILESCINIPGEEVKCIINGGINALIKTQYQQNDIGLKLDFANRFYRLGDFNGVNNLTRISVEDSGKLIILYATQDLQYIVDGDNKLVTFDYLGLGYNGLNLDFANSIYQLGQLTGGNTTYLTIDDAAAFPVQIDGTNVIQGTSGAVSGDHLKVKINGVDYVIELKNP